MFVVRRPQGRWEIRSSANTPRGPRSRTLATFRELDETALARVFERTGLEDAAPLRDLCRRAGAPVAPSAPNRAAARLLSALAHGEKPRRALARVLADQLGVDGLGVTDSERAAARWVGATSQERGDTLRDLLLLADRLPVGSRSALAFPPLPRTQ